MRIDINFKLLWLAENKKKIIPKIISQIIYMFVNINECKKKIYEYIINGLIYNIILRKFWIEYNKIIYYFVFAIIFGYFDNNNEFDYQNKIKYIFNNKTFPNYKYLIL